MKKKIFNLKGFRCPDTMLFLRNKLRSIKTGEVILIISDDITIHKEIIFLCNFSNYILVKYKNYKIPYYYTIKKIKS
ncbi:Sulfur carrier protein TusA [Buchnera aphidicola (Periphyllus testudinaceus)]|uniref:sulfurtransferase TusA family protein n=1 Tax=Buchnera aphidicola TaxID=9 RepID=UPI00346445E2